MLEQALRLAAAGCLVFPIRPGTKKPAIRNWPALATTDADAIRAWWQKWPDANAGIHTRGLLVIDVDGSDADRALQRLRQTHSLPDTIRIVSGNRAEEHHYQLLYRLPTGLRALNKPLDKYGGFKEYDRIDIKSTRGQVVAPGSVHPTGGVYRWEPEPTDLHGQATEAPEWAVRALCVSDAAEGPATPSAFNGRKEKAIPGPETNDDLLLTLAARYRITRPGERNDQMLAAVGWLASKRIPTDQIKRLMTSWLRSNEGLFATPFTGALDELYQIIHRTDRAVAEGAFELPPDHNELTARQTLLPALASFLRDFPRKPEHEWDSSQPTVHESVYRGGRSRSSLLLEERFLEVLLLHYQYRLLQGDTPDRLLMTDRELMAVFRWRFGVGLSWNGLWSMKKKFFTRKKLDGSAAKAKVHELVVMEKSGRVGVPSAYRVTGLPAPGSTPLVDS